jgi:2,3-bisphosphoglycerate-independent phosphoglycerate mutase
MKYAIIFPDGAADEPLNELGGKTPIEAAATPNMDRVATEGRQGVARTVPEGFESGSDVAIMTLLGYDPKVYHTGRAPLEAAAPGRCRRPAPWSRTWSAWRWARRR